MEYKVLIPTAGVGSRLGGLCQYINKSLVTVANKPTISHIVEKFPSDITFVVALGYKGELVKDFLLMAYPQRTFEFVDVSPFEGAGAGLGYTVMQCKSLLQLPFVFCSCDTIVAEDIPEPYQNWMGYADVADASQYRTIKINDTRVEAICEKKSADKDLKAYIGLAGIFDYQDFWEKMELGKNEAIEIGESYGLHALIEKKIQPKSFKWFDTGNLEALELTRNALKKKNAPNILDKANEAIWFIDNQVVKFSADEAFIKNRVERAKLIEEYCPEITAFNRNMYKYRIVEGDVMSKSASVPLFEQLLEHSKGFWVEKSLNKSEKSQFQKTCMIFYKDKTEERVALYFKNFEQEDKAENINGIDMPCVAELLKKIDWDCLADGLSGRFHGDYHFENIIYNEKENTFAFLDWRQEFGGSLEVGDIYYDFAKLNHGLIISHELIVKNLFSVSLNEDGAIRYDFHRKQILVECERAFEKFLIENGYDANKMKMLTAMIFLNIAALHHYPYSLLLFYLGKSMLFKLVK